ncbi:LOW QUALITY PROTEIN: uncharacterized protein LOC132936427 [Metopolophium dirhodum]|uniref:LOW QUALITY PROTEIN: uncharacterized protein LOC132936427 n=1 Tax=Metopolophium dirhodum TaxID=44670 RepID=UPI00298F8A55|nr:LOW QUALITY PROTEIN: uncharacterized protein LOC132936427 [Metopolophium dirhodum]
MGRPQTNPVKKLFFSYNIDKNESVCKIEGCRRPVIKGSVSHNLETHIRTTHPDEAIMLDKAKEDIKKLKFVNSGVKRPNDEDNSCSNKKHGPLDKHISVEKKKLNINLNKSSLLEACTEMVTINGRPLTIFNDSGFSKILRPLTEAIGGGITIQYIKNGEITLKTLAMVELFDTHTAENLKQSLLDVLVKYEITREQIYTITCDNAANMIKMARIMTVNDIENDFVDESDEVNDNTTDINNEDSDNEYPSGGTPISNEDIENELLIDLFNTDEATISIQSFEDDVFDALCPSPITSCVRCAVHTLQLCILDGFKNAPITSCIVQARKVVKKLRTPKSATWLKRKNLKYAIIDNETRWNSVFNMLFRLLELKEFCQTHHSTNTELKLKKSEWDSIQSIVDALMPVKIATLALQKQDINLGDFFGVWLKASHGLQSNGSILAKQILKSMKQREVLLLKNPIFLAAIFLDPRYQCILNETDKNTGINHLIKTWKCMIQIQDVCQTDDVNNSAIANVIDSPDNTAETIDDGFELFLSSQTSVASNRSETNILNDISTSLHNFKNVERLHYKTNILAFWESQKHDKSDLYKLANIVLAVPATQVYTILLILCIFMWNFLFFIFSG